MSKSFNILALPISLSVFLLFALPSYIMHINTKKAYTVKASLTVETRKDLRTYNNINELPKCLWKNKSHCSQHNNNTNLKNVKAVTMSLNKGDASVCLLRCTRFGSCAAILMQTSTGENSNQFMQIMPCSVMLHATIL